MFKKTMMTLSTLLLAAPMVMANIALANDVNPDGIWRLTNGRVTVKVVHCGANICANIVALAKPNYPDGTPLLDALNPNPALKKRPVMGLPVISGMVQTGPNTYHGNIYNADDGGTYRATATLTATTMMLKGCWLVFCRDSNFVRLK